VKAREVPWGKRILNPGETAAERKKHLESKNRHSSEGRSGVKPGLSKVWKKVCTFEGTIVIEEISIDKK